LDDEDDELGEEIDEMLKKGDELNYSEEEEEDNSDRFLHDFGGDFDDEEDDEPDTDGSGIEKVFEEEIDLDEEDEPEDRTAIFPHMLCRSSYVELSSNFPDFHGC
jgi:hypothetical protein